MNLLLLFHLGFDVFQEVSNLLAGGLSRADEEDVEAELDELIRADEESEIHRLPDVPQHQRGKLYFYDELKFILVLLQVNVIVYLLYLQHE